MATILKPKTLQEVLAEQALSAPVATTTTPVDTKSINQAQAEANRVKAAEREAARQAGNNTLSASIPVPTTTPTVDLGGGAAYVSSKFPGQAFATKSAMDTAITTGVVTPGSTLSRTVTTPTNVKSTPSTIQSPEVPKIDTGSKTPKVQVGKLVSDFNSTLQSSGLDKEKYYSGINYEGLSDENKKRADTLFDMRQKAEDKKVSKMDIYDKYGYDITKATKAMQAQYDADKAAMIDAAGKEKDTMTKEYDTGVSEYESAFSTFSDEQNKLLNNYESNRLNQVQGDLRRALLSRGVDISKVPPEQLIALSGSIGAQAFSDISGAKERATTAIETARQNKISQVRDLKSKKAITESQYNKTLADINSTANQAKNNLDLKFAETVFGIKTAKDTKAETAQTNTAQAIMNTAQSLGVSGSQFGVVNKFIQNAKSTPEALQAMFAELSNPESDLYTIIQSNESAAAKQQAFKNQIDLLEAQAKLKSASRTGGSGTTQNAYSTGQ